MVAMACVMASQRPERVPGRIPLRCPATERSWQGEPPVMMSTGSTRAQLTAVTSPRFGASGNRWVRTLLGPASISETHAVRTSVSVPSPSDSPP